MMMKSPSKEEKVVDKKAATPTQQPSDEVTHPPEDGAGVGAAGRGAGGPAEAGEGVLFETFYPLTFQEGYSDTSTDVGSKYSPPKAYQKSTPWSIKTRHQARKDTDRT